jgi:hypothetical protein
MVQEFRVGDALGRGAAIWLRNLPAFLVLAILVYSPAVVYTAVTTSRPLLGDTAGLEQYHLVILLLQFPLNVLATAAVLYGTIQQLRGRHVAIGASIGVGLRRLFPILGVGLLSTLLSEIWLGVVFLPYGEALLYPALVPALLFSCMLYVAVPAAVIERPGLLGALRRSRALTAGRRVHILLILFALGALHIVASLLVTSLFDPDTLTDHELKLSMWLSLGVNIALAALTAAVNGVVYHDLRVAVDGASTDDLVRVFE